MYSVLGWACLGVVVNIITHAQLYLKYMKEFTQEIETQHWKDSVSRIMPGALWPKIYDPQACSTPS